MLSEPLLITKLVLLALVIIAMVSDLIQMRIPNILPVAIILLFPVAYFGGETSTSLLDHLGAMSIMLVAGIVLFAFKILGGGDVKFMSSLALWTGLELLPSFVIVFSIVGGVQAIMVLMLRKQSQPIEYLLAKCKIQVPEWLGKDGGLPYGLAIGVALMILFDQLPFWAS